ncbi:phosphoserine phosphatase SerB [Kordiimonas aquimaris]|uniref:phosphoserine phosphatase SerB n=1 Tax=Kordiimonas aquimaris TaxID=707591 RepID=UPI0021D126F4|nr:phosphoserine phosphatase SerB [Kordiimonas aquimaris]
MDIVLTLVVNPGDHQTFEKARSSAKKVLEAFDCTETPLSEQRALDIKFNTPSIGALYTQFASTLDKINGLDWCLQTLDDTRRKLMLIADMDSTMITVECIDELADFVGLKDKVSHITEAAMRGELEFEDALKERVALLAGLKQTDLEKCYNDRIQIMPGAETLVKTMKKNGAFAALVSGGFTFFTKRVAGHIGFDDNRANILLDDNGALTGQVAEPICGAETKLEALKEYCSKLNIKQSHVLAVGDGANDIPMINAAGLGVAYHAKPKTAAEAKAAVRYGDLTTLLFFQGYSETEFVVG